MTRSYAAPEGAASTARAKVALDAYAGLSGDTAKTGTALGDLLEDLLADMQHLAFIRSLDWSKASSFAASAPTAEGAGE